MQRKKIFSLNMFIVAAATGLLATGAQAALDAPHNASNFIGCTNCHQMTSTYPKLLPPLDHTPVDIDDTLANNVCWSCHNDVDAVHTETHSSTLLGTTYGNWSVECWVCHNEHQQEQNLYNGSTYGKYIRRTVDLSKITNAGKTGKLPVVFTGPTTFADGLSPYNGICEVCHTLTTHFQNDGGGADNNHSGQGGSNCTGCHNHSTSFQGGADHSTFITDDNETGNAAKLCSSCHTGYAANPETAHSACSVCHTTAPTLLDSAFPTYNGQPDDDGTSMFANLTDAAVAPYTQYIYPNGGGRLEAPGGLVITSVGFPKVRCGECHKAKPNALQAGNHGGHSATDFPWDATTQTSCGTVGCHDYAANGNVVANIHGNVCTVCHNNAAGGDGTTIVGSATNGIDGDATLGSTAAPHADNCLVCHPAATYDRSTVHHDSKTGYAAAGNCTQCHAGTNYPGDHSARVSLAANCLDCHSGTQGNPGGIPLDATDATPAARKIHDACTTCHNTDNDATLKAPYGVAQAMPGSGTPSNDGGGSCEACHTSGFDGYHATVNHASMVSMYANCSGCHDGTQAPAGGGSVPLAPADPKKHDTCTQCHDVDGRLLGSANGNNGGTPGGSDGGGSCFICHGEYFTNHSHTHTFTADASCATCHGNPSPVGTNARDAITAPFTAAGEVHSSTGCTTCHDASGALVGSATGQTAGATCTTCHIGGANTWTTVHTAALGTVQPAVDHTGLADSAAACTTCHGNNVAGSNARDAITAPFHGTGEIHNGSGCATCHTGNDDGSLRSLGLTKADTVAAGDCTTCHTATSTWTTIHDTATGAVTGVSHATRVDVLATCTTSCHTATAGGANGVMPYSAADNKVHDACATCHQASGTLKAGNTTYGGQPIAKGDCGTCHGAGYFDSHTHTHTLVRTAECATCHNEDTTDGSNATLAPAASVPWVAAGQTHNTTTGGNGCAACHNVAVDGVLKGSATGGTTTSSCESCHITTAAKTWTQIHTATIGTGAGTVDHSRAQTQVANDANCSGCHANVATSDARDAITTPFHGAGEVHNGAGCATCHTGANTGALRSGGLTKADTVASGTCGTCHTVTSTWTTIHDTATGAVAGVSHATRVDGLAACTICHSATAGGAAGVMPYSVSDDKVHDACATCHQATGALNSGNTTYGNQPIAKGDCGTCHTAGYFNSHTHHYGANNELSYNSSVDLAQDAPGTPCASCHTNNDDAAGTPLDSFTDILGEHVTGCGRCHSYTNADGQGTPPLATNNSAISTAGAKSCTSCHTPKLTPATHGGHDASQFAWSPSCSAAACHDQASNPDVANDIHGDGTTATCTLCHLTASGGTGTTKVGARGDGDATLGNSAAPHALVNCLTCHNAADPDVNGDDAFDSYGAIHHDTKTAINNNCTTCHSGGYDHTALVADEPAGVNTLYGCVTCHTSAAGSGSVPTVSLTDPMVHDACRTCHTFRPAPNMDGDLRTLAAASKGVPAGQLPTGVTILGGADGGGTCVACHSNGTVDSYHHTNANTPIGNCDWCHEDPRLTAPQSGFTKPPELTPSRVPTQLLCIECHMAPLNHNGGGTNAVPTAVSGTNVSNTRVTAWASSTMTIYAFDKGSDARKTATSWKTAYPRTTVHQVTNTAAKIDNWGICLGCHDGTASRVAAGAAQVNPIHAMPTTISPTQTYCLTADVAGVGLAMYLPGRSTYNNISNINYYGDYFKPRATRPRTTQNIRNVAWTGGSANCGDLTGGTYSRTWQYNKNARSAGQTMYGTSSTYSTITIPNPWGAGSTFQNYYVQNWPLGQDSTVTGDNAGPDAPTGIPTFEVTRPITTSTDQIAVDGDNVKVVSAIWNGTNTLTVTATNSDGCGSLNLVYPSGGTQVVNGFSGTGPCTATYGLANLSLGTTVDVTTDNTTGLNVIGYPITQP